MVVEGYVLDVETNGFYFQADKMWTAVFKDLKDPEKKLVVNPFKDTEAVKKIEKWHSQYNNPIIAAHYGLGFDLFVIFKLLGIPFTVGKDTFFNTPCRFIDTFYLSQYVDPDLDGHSIEAWGERLGLEKIDYFDVAIQNNIIPKDSKKGDEFSVYHPLMDEYCERDCDVLIKVFWHLWKSFSSFYKMEDGELPNHFKCGQKSFYLMSCQEFTGWKFDIDYANELVPKIQGMMKEIEDNVLPQLPPRKLKKGEMKEYSMPMKPFKQDGTFSSHMNNFIKKHNGVIKGNGIVEFYGKDYQVVGQLLLDVKLPMEIKDSDDLKAWFMNGWVKKEFLDLYENLEWVDD